MWDVLSALAGFRKRKGTAQPLLDEQVALGKAPPRFGL